MKVSEYLKKPCRTYLQAVADSISTPYWASLTPGERTRRTDRAKMERLDVTALRQQAEV